MKNLIVLLSSIAMMALVSCSMKTPMPLDQSKGIVALPIKVTNSTNQTRIGFNYLLTDYKRQDVQILIKPVAGQEVIFSQELEPGDYQLYKVTTRFDMTTTGIADANETSRSLYKPIRFKVEAGKVAVPRELITVKSTQEDSESYYTTFGTAFLPQEDRNALIVKIQESENGKYWGIASE